VGGRRPSHVLASSGIIGVLASVGPAGAGLDLDEQLTMSPINARPLEADTTSALQNLTQIPLF
jgi:hypothetical protein